MTDACTPIPAAPLLSRAAQQLTALADPSRAALLAAAVRLHGARPATLPELAADLDHDVRTVARHTAALEAAGLVTVSEHRVGASLATLAETAEELLAALPITALLAEEPDLARLFRYGRLLELPLLGRVEERHRLAALLVQLLPDGERLTEAEVNAALRTVTDDVALVRRFLVEEGVVGRDASADYRREPVEDPADKTLRHGAA